MTIRAKACDALRGLLPAATRSNVGIYATAQSYEQLLLRMRANPLAEVRAYADLVLAELRKVIPAFLTRVDLPDRGGRWSEYLRTTRAVTELVAYHLVTAYYANVAMGFGLAPGQLDASSLASVLGVLANQGYREIGADVATSSGSSRWRERCPRRSGPQFCGPVSVTGRTAGTSRAARSNDPPTGSMCCATTGRSATSSGTGCSRSNGSPCRRCTASRFRRRFETSAPPRIGTA